MSLASPKPVPAVERLATPGQHHQRLNRLRDQESQRRMTLVVFGLFATVVVLVTLTGVVDYFAMLGYPLRLAAWAAITLVVIASAMRLRKWLSFDSIDAVCEAENAWPEIGQRLRTSHDYQMIPDHVTPANPELLKALESETQERVLERPVAPLGKSWPIAALAGFCGVVAIGWLSTMVLSPDWRVTTGRIMLLPLNYSSVQMEPLPETLDQGDDLIVTLHVDGRPIDSAVLKYRFGHSKEGESEEWKEVLISSVNSESLLGELTATIPDCQDDLEIQIIAVPFGDDVHTVPVRLPLFVEAWETSVTPPAYTGLPTAKANGEDTRIPEGSQVQLAAQYNRAPENVAVSAVPQATVPRNVAVSDSTVMISMVTGRDSIQVTANASASDGVRDDSSLLLDVVPDRAPVVKFSSPKEDAEAIATEELRFTMEAFDDYGITSLELRYRIDDGPEQSLRQVTPEQAVAAVAETVTLALEDLELSYPQSITYYAVATDNRAPENQRITSELRFVDIRPFSREYEFKEGECNCQGECLTLEKLIKQQREILGQTFAETQRQDRNEAEVQDVGAKLATEEQDVLDKTQGLKAALEQKVGPLPSLTSATDWMTDAVEDLDQGKLDAGQLAEEKALAGLVAARRNLRQMLKSSSSASQMVRKVDQQQKDKVRKPPSDKKPEQKDQEQQLADIRKQLEQLARKQESFCQSASASSSSSSGSPKKPSSSPTETDQSESEKSPQQLAEQQRQAADEARELERQIEQGEFGELAAKRMGKAGDAINQSAQSMENPEPSPEEVEQAIQQASDAAEQLKRLSAHLAARHNPDFGDKLATAKRKASQLADAQKELSDAITAPEAESGNSQQDQGEDGLSDDQHRLADRTEELADLVQQLLADSTQQDWQVQESLSKQVSQNSPRQAAAKMERAAQAIARGQAATASKSGQGAADSLQRFAAGLGQVQQTMGPARLAKLTKAEKRAAELIKALRRGAGAAEQAMAVAESARLAESIRPLAHDDDELSEAVDALPRFAKSPTLLVEGLRQLDEVLQREIQQAIVAGVMQEADGPVPPEYAEMVDDYFRVLSDDVE